MTALALLALGLICVALAAPVTARSFAARRSQARRSKRRVCSPIAYDPGRERRAELRARQLLRSCVNEEEWAMYRDLGFIRIDGRRLPSDTGAGGSPSYAYLVYPHKPIVAYVPTGGRLLSEYCVSFPDMTGEEHGARLPASDDVLAKWMALTSDEARVIGQANMHLVGRQHDPSRLRRDLWRLSEWERRRGHAVEARRA